MTLEPEWSNRLYLGSHVGPLYDSYGPEKRIGPSGIDGHLTRIRSHPYAADEGVPIIELPTPGGRVIFYYQAGFWKISFIKELAVGLRGYKISLVDAEYLADF